MVRAQVGDACALVSFFVGEVGVFYNFSLGRSHSTSCALAVPAIDVHSFSSEKERTKKEDQRV